MEGLINWKAVSRLLTKNDTSIRSNRVPKKYEAQVQELKDLLEYWKRRNG